MPFYYTKTTKKRKEKCQQKWENEITQPQTELSSNVLSTILSFGSAMRILLVGHVNSQMFWFDDQTIFIDL